MDGDFKWLKWNLIIATIALPLNDVPASIWYTKPSVEPKPNKVGWLRGLFGKGHEKLAETRPEVNYNDDMSGKGEDARPAKNMVMTTQKEHKNIHDAAKKTRKQSDDNVGSAALESLISQKPEEEEPVAPKTYAEAQSRQEAKVEKTEPLDLAA